MIELIDVKFRNILSYGNNWTTFEFKKGIYKISAPNGVGKSTLVDVLNFVLFGSAFRDIKKSQLINSKNKKNMEVILRFKKQEYNFRVERGLKPDIFKIYKDDVLVPISSSIRGYQDILIEDFLQFDENIYNQVTVKSSTKNSAFMKLSKAEKRRIVENLLDIEIFSIMGKNLKTKIDADELELKSLKKDIENHTLLIAQEQSNIEQLSNLKRRIEEDSNKNIQIYKNEIVQLNESNLKYNKGLEIIEKKKLQKTKKLEEIQKVKEEITDLTKNISKYEAVLDLHNKKIKFLNNTCGDCPKIKELMNDNDVSYADAIVDQNKARLPESKNLLLKLEDELKKMNEILANENFVKDNLSRNKKRIAELTLAISKSSESVIEIDELKLKLYIRDKKSLEIRYNELHNKKNHLVLLRSLCSDGGIKPLIIKKYLPTINKLLNTYLTKFQADIIFNFDSEFNEVILSKYKENFTYESFSEGQKKRIDLAVMFAFIKFAQMKNKKSDTNLMIMDEVLSGLDQQGTESVMEVLRDYRDKNNKNIITINHLTDLNEEYFDDKYRVTLEKGFSKITKEQL